jgi:hypothetical protein
VPTAEAASGPGWGLGSLAVSSGLSHPICITVEIQPACSNGSQLTSASYNGTHDRTNALANYLGHGASGTYSFAIGAEATFVVAVTEMTEGAGCSGWHETITSDGPWVDGDKRPRIQGSAAIGSILSATDAIWKTSPSPTVERSWRRCDPAGTGCADIPGATGANYTVAEADIGHTLLFSSVATDQEGTSRSNSRIVEPFIPFEEHSNESLGSGDRVQDGVLANGLNESHCGIPKPPPPIFAQDSRFLFDQYPIRSLLNEPVCLVARTAPVCDPFSWVTPSIYRPVFAPASGLTTNYAASSAFTASQPATASTILPPAGVAEAVVTDTSSATSCAQYALTLGADAPFASARPTVQGTAAEGETLTAGNGAWSGSPSFSHSWLSCDAAGESCTSIDGAGAATYTPTTADVGRRLRVRVTATQGRSVSSDSEPSAIVTARPGQPGGGPGDRTAPKATLRLARTTLQKVVKKGFIPVTVTCDEASAIAVGAVVKRKLGRALGGKRIARGRATCRPGRRGSVKVKLTRRARRGLKQRRSIAFTLRGTATDAAGNSGAVTKSARLKRRR